MQKDRFKILEETCAFQFLPDECILDCKNCNNYEPEFTLLKKMN